MDCISCRCAATRIVETRAYGPEVLRRRRCQTCGCGWSTREIVIQGSEGQRRPLDPLDPTGSLPVAHGQSTGSPPVVRGGEGGVSVLTLLPESGVRSGPSSQIRKKSERDGPAYSPDFLRFWAAYPHKTKKQAAWRAWLRMRPPIEKCLTTLQWQTKSEDWVKEGGRFIPHPATWINGGSWEDERPAPPPPRKLTGGSLW
jgi:hypothetical protein